ncbi:ATP-dependent DNA helicase [Kordiimonas laminariae]|uniref:ATP-dependent DNA helicase n=1 Tax=Kordiimonas laminariae TaxID=2917717 RepID=UPI001FF4C445|nr:ATP-dependent DNA helicase [Kordiimonas laminariae]MCK0070118.1 ATP-dependent DNA helicase [Kordiimonas laminariae]
MSDLFGPDLVVEADRAGASLEAIPVAVVGVRFVTILTEHGEFEELDHETAAKRLSTKAHMLVNRVMAARRLGMPYLRAYDLLELYAFVRPARYCLPTVQGLLEALVLDKNTDTHEDICLALHTIAERLLSDMAAETYRYRAGGGRVLMMMAKAGWTWGPLALGYMEEFADHSREDGLLVWTSLPEWEDGAPPPPPGDEAIEPEESLSRLTELLGNGSEQREGQKRYAAAATHVFRPREMLEGPNIQLLEAGTGTGKTLGYIAPASRWAERNDGAVWLSTYTKNLQRQLDQELSKLYPDPRVKDKRAVIRKGRENYACLLNIEETTRAVMMRTNPNQGEDRDKILIGLVARWARYTRDGDMIGGDFPSWLGAHFGVGRIAGLTDRRGECLYSACAHFRRCYIEKSARKAKHADLVVANHALVIAQAVSRIGDPDLPKRLVFDEGHHVFDAADSAFSLNLSGLEGAELRRWIRGKESGGSTRARGLKSRLEELVADDMDAQKLLEETLEAARLLPSDNWMGRVAGSAPVTRFETFLMHIRAQVLTRADGRGPHTIECSIADPIEGLVEAGQALFEGLAALSQPMSGLSNLLIKRLDEDSDVLDSTSRGRLESSARSLKQRAEIVTNWAAMAEGLGKLSPEGFIDWFEIERIDGRERDIGYHRHFIDPTKPFSECVLAETHGTLITSATLRDKATEVEDWQSADMRTGAQHLMVPPKRLSVLSPFDYPKSTKVLIVGDVNKMDAVQVAAAYRALFMASGGGALGLFTAISRLRTTYEYIAGNMEENGMPLYAQHVDPVDTATLVDIFRDDPNSCLLGTDAVRDGVDVPGDSLRLIVFDRVPWPRPTILHRARRNAFGGRHYDEMLTRLKLAQAFGRLVRRANDRGVFVMLDGQTPTRLMEAMPEGVEIERVGLAEAVKSVREFFSSEGTN